MRLHLRDSSTFEGEYFMRVRDFPEFPADDMQVRSADEQKELKFKILIPICKRHASMTWRRQCASMISWLTKSCKYVGGAVERGVEFKVYQEYLIDCSAYQFSR